MKRAYKREVTELGYYLYILWEHGDYDRVEKELVCSFLENDINAAKYLRLAADEIKPYLGTNGESVDNEERYITSYNVYWPTDDYHSGLAKLGGYVIKELTVEEDSEGIRIVEYEIKL